MFDEGFDQKPKARVFDSHDTRPQTESEVVDDGVEKETQSEGDIDHNEAQERGSSVEEFKKGYENALLDIVEAHREDSKEGFREVFMDVLELQRSLAHTERNPQDLVWASVQQRKVDSLGGKYGVDSTVFDLLRFVSLIKKEEQRT